MYRTADHLTPAEVAEAFRGRTLADADGLALWDEDLAARPDRWAVVVSYAPNLGENLGASNHAAALERLEAVLADEDRDASHDGDTSPVQDIRVSSWATPLDYVIVDLDVPDVAAEGAAIVLALQDYPALDEEDLGRRELEDSEQAVRDDVVRPAERLVEDRREAAGLAPDLPPEVLEGLEAAAWSYATHVGYGEDLDTTGATVQAAAYGLAASGLECGTAGILDDLPEWEAERYRRGGSRYALAAAWREARDATARKRAEV